MGIAHFAPVGTSPGAVTSALGYFQHSPGVRGTYTGTIVQDIVVFCSHDVDRGDRPADDFVWNEYGRPHPCAGWRASQKKLNAIEVIKDFIVRERVLSEKGHLYVWAVDVEDFEVCFEAVAMATLALGRAEGTGRYIWANLTGGTNILNAAVLEVSFLSGLIGRLYYTFLGQTEDRKYLLPPGADKSRFALDWVPTAKTQFDQHYYRVLKALAALDDWCEDEALLQLLAQDEYSLPHEEQKYFDRMPLPSFRTQLLNRMDGREIEREERGGGKTHRVRLAVEGRAALDRIRTPLFEALVRRGQAISPELAEECRRELESRQHL